jgi:hypothetical protein
VIGAIFSAAAGFFQSLATALGWMKQASDQNIGKQLQAGTDAQASLQEDRNAQAIDASVGTESRAALIDELRGPTAGST